MSIDVEYIDTPAQHYTFIKGNEKESKLLAFTAVLLAVAVIVAVVMSYVQVGNMFITMLNDLSRWLVDTYQSVNV